MNFRSKPDATCGYGINRIAGVIASCTLLFAVLLSSPAFSSERAPAGLEQVIAQIERFSADSGGQLGVAVEHLGSGHAFSVNASESYPLASTYKVATAVYLMHLVDEGRLELGQMVTVEPRQVAPGGMPIAHFFPHDGVALSVKNLLEVMLTESSNTATDVLMELVGGGEVITAFLREQGFDNIRIDRTTATLIRNYAGWPTPADPNISLRDQWSSLVEAQGEEALNAEFEKPERYSEFLADPRDQATPVAMNELLKRIWSDEIISPQSSQLIREIMARCRTGENRLKGLLPSGTVVAHKTGTIGETLNDVGVITLPGGAGQIAISAFIKLGKAPWEGRERAIAEVARTVYDFYLANPGLTH